ncbi:MAG: SIS domain-containing protein [Patescibacteria group bacterium]
MNQLDDQKKIEAKDTGHVLETISLLPKQIEQTWNDVQKVVIPKSYRSVQNIVVNGMGGSGLGAHILFSLFYDQLPIPLRVIHSYTMPAYVNKKTLYVLSSYSGTTEEPLATAKEALKRGAKVIGITTGGEVKDFCLKNNLPCFLFNPIYNPSNQPRMGVGYSVFGILGLLKRCGIIDLDERDVNKVITHLDLMIKKFSENVAVANNPAKRIAEELHGTIPICVAAEFLTGNVHTLTNQLNENSKNFSAYFLLSELNHHLLEGLAAPKIIPQALRFMFIESALYHPRNKVRFPITKKIVKRNKVEFSSYQAEGKTKLLQSFEVLLFGSYLSYYLAYLNHVDPVKIPWVDFFKQELKK